MNQSTTNKSNSPEGNHKGKKHIHKWPDRNIIQAQVLYLQGNTAKQVEALIDMPERSVNRFIGKTPDDPRHSIESNTKTSAWHDLCWEKALDKFSDIRNKDQNNKGMSPLPREKRKRRSDPEITGCDHPRVIAKQKADAQAKAKVDTKARTKINTKSTSPPTTISPLPRQSKLPTSPDGSGVGPVRTSPTIPRASAFGVTVDPAQAALNNQIAARRAKRAGGLGASTLSAGSSNAFGTSSIRSTLGKSQAGSIEMPAGLEAYSRLGLGKAALPLLGKLQLGEAPGVANGAGSGKENDGARK